MYIYNLFNHNKKHFFLKSCVFLYVCGSTVHDDSHLGHVKLFVCFDIILRYFLFNGVDVFFVRNITDIDSKLEKKILYSGVDINYFVTNYTLSMYRDNFFLHLLKPSFEPLATGFIFYIQYVIEYLIRKNYAYVMENGDVYFNVLKFKRYGYLSSQQTKLLKHGLQLLKEILKKNSIDFVLWKNFKPNQLVWFSKWGYGRPGWHIECTAMIFYFFGSVVDFHGGGVDLIFPHHENELAQAESITQFKFVKFWLHVGLLMVDKRKMSKSFFNFIKVNLMLNVYNENYVRCFLLSLHYRKPLHYSFFYLLLSMKIIKKIYNIFIIFCLSKLFIKYDVIFETRFGLLFFYYMDDDFNTSACVSIFMLVYNEVIKLRRKFLYEEVLFLLNVLLCFCYIFGFFKYSINKLLNFDVGYKGNIVIYNIFLRCFSELSLLRCISRIKKQWFLSDLLRYVFFINGLVIEDL